MEKELKRIEELKLRYDINKTYAFAYFAALLVISFGLITHVNFFLFAILFVLILCIILYYRNQMLKNYNKLLSILSK
jgi:uncharacterized membrane protein